MLVPKLVLKSRALPQDLVRTSLLDLGHVGEAVLARARREAVLVDPLRLVEDGAAERRVGVLQCITNCSTAEINRRPGTRSGANLYQARAARGRTRPGGCPG